MAIEDRNCASQSSKPMTAQEYLTWLLSIEHQFSNLPGGTRAYLVSIDPITNTRTLTPVGADASVINLQTGLVKYLREELVSTELLQDIRRACVERLAERGIKAEANDQDKRTASMHLEDADTEAIHLGKQLRAVATAIERILPADVFKHPLLLVSSEGRPDDSLRVDLRAGISAVRQFAKSIDHIGCSLEDGVSYGIEEAMTALGLGQPSSSRSEAGHD